MKVVKYEMIDLPEIAIIGKEGLCTKEKNVAQELWQQANSAFREIADLGMKNTDGSFVGFWGAMSDETLSFLPWTEDFSRGLYLAGVEVYEDAAAPTGGRRRMRFYRAGNRSEQIVFSGGVKYRSRTPEYEAYLKR